MRPTYTIDPDTEIVEVGDAAGLPALICVDVDDDRVEVHFDLEVRGGLPGVTCITVKASPFDDDPPLVAADLAHVRLDDLVKSAVADNLYERRELDDGRVGWSRPASDKAIAAVVGAMPRRRNATTASRLQLALDAFERGGIGEVVEALKVSKSQAYRLVNKAKNPTGGIRR